MLDGGVGEHSPVRKEGVVVHGATGPRRRPRTCTCHSVPHPQRTRGHRLPGRQVAGGTKCSPCTARCTWFRCRCTVAFPAPLPGCAGLQTSPVFRPAKPPCSPGKPLFPLASRLAHRIHRFPQPDSFQFSCCAALRFAPPGNGGLTKNLPVAVHAAWRTHEMVKLRISERRKVARKYLQHIHGVGRRAGRETQCENHRIWRNCTAVVWAGGQRVARKQLQHVAWCARGCRGLLGYGGAGGRGVCSKIASTTTCLSTLPSPLPQVTDALEAYLGGHVVWRSGRSIWMYRGQDYKPYSGKEGGGGACLREEGRRQDPVAPTAS